MEHRPAALWVRGLIFYLASLCIGIVIVHVHPPVGRGNPHLNSAECGGAWSMSNQRHDSSHLICHQYEAYHLPFSLQCATVCIGGGKSTAMVIENADFWAKKKDDDCGFEIGVGLYQSFWAAKQLQWIHSILLTYHNCPYCGDDFHTKRFLFYVHIFTQDAHCPGALWSA